MTFVKTIRFFGYKHPLSNFYASNIFMDNVTYPTAEHRYQSKKCKDSMESVKIIMSPTPLKARKLGGKCNNADNWNDIKLLVMYKTLHAKFTQNMKLTYYLLNTEDAILIENNKHDDYWGIGDGTGKNMLGKLLMRLRKEIKDKIENNKENKEDKPVMKEYPDGTKKWYLNDRLHREDGPAIEWSDGIKCWYINGKLHREDGPAVEYPDGNRYWWLNDKIATEQEVMKDISKEESNVFTT